MYPELLGESGRLVILDDPSESGTPALSQYERVDAGVVLDCYDIRLQCYTALFPTRRFNDERPRFTPSGIVEGSGRFVIRGVADYSAPEKGGITPPLPDGVPAILRVVIHKSPDGDTEHAMYEMQVYVDRLSAVIQSGQGEPQQFVYDFTISGLIKKNANV